MTQYLDSRGVPFNVNDDVVAVMSNGVGHVKGVRIEVRDGSRPFYHGVRVGQAFKFENLGGGFAEAGDKIRCHIHHKDGVVVIDGDAENGWTLPIFKVPKSSVDVQPPGPTAMETVQRACASPALDAAIKATTTQCNRDTDGDGNCHVHPEGCS